MVKPSLTKVEQTFLKSVTDKIDDPVLNDRLVYLFHWYTRKAQINKRWYHWTRFITYLIPCAITLISVFATMIDKNSKWAINVIATFSAVLVGIHHVIDHFRYYENWVRYRGTAEKLKRESELFLNRCEPYNKGSVENKKRFAAKIERITRTEIAEWENLQEESHKPFKDENQSSLQSGSGQLGQTGIAAVASVPGADDPDSEEQPFSETACDSQQEPET